jgi:peroxiredoxin
MKTRALSALSVAALALGIAACGKEPAPQAAAPSSGAANTTTVAAAAIASDARAEIGKPAPDFTLKDLDGKDVKLSSYKGKLVVLEWFNPGCPFVKRSHGKGSLKNLAANKTKDGIVWLAINSSAPGREGNGLAANREAAQSFGMTHPVLLDEQGVVGKAFGATNTPHMFVIDDKGTLVYRGAIDNSPDGEGENAPDGKVVVYVDEAIAALRAGKAVPTAETKAYGCSVKYAK